MENSEDRGSPNPGAGMIAAALECIARYSARLDEISYASLVMDIDGLHADLDTREDTPADTETLSWFASAKIPSWESYRAFSNQVLTSGFPTSALPVESLYRPWHREDTGLDGPSVAFSRSLGLFDGDSAWEMRRTYTELGIDIPTRFSAMPDHLSLMIELLITFMESDDPECGPFADTHFDWLHAYLKKLDAIAELVNDDARPALAYHRGLVRIALELVDTLGTETSTAPVRHRLDEEVVSTSCDAECHA